MASIYEKLGNRIKQLRKKAGLSQEELAEKAKLDLNPLLDNRYWSISILIKILSYLFYPIRFLSFLRLTLLL
jgi:transcriptional regulator with XRE-family HTH domain